MKESILVKIKKIFKSLFSNKNLTLSKAKMNQPSDGFVSLKTNDKEFIKTIKTQHDENKVRLLNLQNKFSNGEIKEEDISEEDANLLREMYEQQIEDLKEEVSKYKEEIFKMWEQKGHIGANNG
ncbi:MAG: hypothetical protein FWF46_04445 [Oscillospiraceae bacterium]|nr:hypothetical protein [Oscillospiraceae bacterium]